MNYYSKRGFLSDRFSVVVLFISILVIYLKINETLLASFVSSSSVPANKYSVMLKDCAVLQQ